MIVKVDRSIRIAYPELRGSIENLTYPAFIEPKYDGELNVWIGDRLVNKYGKQRWDFPAVSKLPGDHKLIGELYVGDGHRGRLYDLLSKKEDDSLNFKVFDVIDLPYDLITRKEWLFEHLPPENLIETMYTENQSTIVFQHDTIITMGFEGSVVKSIHGTYHPGPIDWVKLKLKDENEYKVCLIDPIKERIEVYVPVVNKTQSQTTLSRLINVGVKCLNKDKQNLKLGDTVRIEHQGILASGSLRHPVYKGKA